MPFWNWIWVMPLAMLVVGAQIVLVGYLLISAYRAVRDWIRRIRLRRAANRLLAGL